MRQFGEEHKGASEGAHTGGVAVCDEAGRAVEARAVANMVAKIVAERLVEK